MDGEIYAAKTGETQMNVFCTAGIPPPRGWTSHRPTELPRVKKHAQYRA